MNRNVPGKMGHKDIQTIKCEKRHKNIYLGFPGGAVVENLPAGAGYTG